MWGWLWRWLYCETAVDYTIRRLTSPHHRPQRFERECPLCGQDTVIYYPNPAPGAAWQCQRCHNYHMLSYY